MRIVVAGNYNDKKAGANFYATVRKLTNGFARNGHMVLPYSDRDVSRRAGPWGIGRAGAGEANRQLVEVCRDFRPDLLVMMHVDQISNDILREIRVRLPSLRLAAINLDPLFLVDNPPRIHRLAEVADVTFITTAGEKLKEFVTPSHRVAFIPNPVDRSIEILECFARTDQSHDLFCSIGGDQGPSSRAELLRQLKRAWPEGKTAFYGVGGQKPIFGVAYFDAIANARMGLNLNRQNGDYLYSSDRLAQYAGNGLLTFVDRATGYGDIFADDEFVFYQGIEELVDRLRYYQGHDQERQSVARKGHARYHQIFNERLVCRFIEEVAFEQSLSSDYAWPTDIYRG